MTGLSCLHLPSVGLMRGLCHGHFTARAEERNRPVDKCSGATLLDWCRGG